MEGYCPTSGYPNTTRWGMVGLSNPRARPSFDPHQREASQADMGYRPHSASDRVQVPWTSSQSSPAPLVAEQSNVRRVSHSVRLRLPSFNGKGKWSTFIRQFESLAANGKWDENEKLGHLWAALSDDAADYAFELEPEILDNYPALVMQLERRFKVKHTKETNQRLFYSRTMRSGENYRQFAASLKSLVHKAYPTGLTNEVREDMLLKQFFDGLSDAEEARYYVKYLQRPQSLDEAVDLMQEYQGYRGKGKAMKRHPVCMVRPAEDDDDDDDDDDEGISSSEAEHVRALFPSKKQKESSMEDLCANVRDLTKAVTRLLEQNSKPQGEYKPGYDRVLGKKQDKSKLRCFNCQGFGHISRECPSPKEKSQEEKTVKQNANSRQSIRVKQAEHVNKASGKENSEN